MTVGEAAGWSLDSIEETVAQALETSQKHLGMHFGAAHKYRADVAPFAWLEQNSAAALRDLATLMPSGEYTYFFGERPPEVEQFECKGPFGVLQMIFPPQTTLPESLPDVELTRLSCDDGPAMVGLTDAAFPGFFRPRTCEMGDYYGVRDGGRLVAMGGERLVFGRYREISGVCTLADQRGKGLAARIIGQLLHDHRRDGLQSWLNVTATNQHAIDLYLRLGFVRVRVVPSYRMTRVTGRM